MTEKNTMNETETIHVKEEVQHEPWCGKNCRDPVFGIMSKEGRRPTLYWGHGEVFGIAFCHPVTEEDHRRFRENEIMDVMMMFAPPATAPLGAEIMLRRRLAEEAVKEVAEAVVPPVPKVDDDEDMVAKARRQAAFNARYREVEAEENRRMPNWETDTPPSLADDQAAILAKHLAAAAEKYPMDKWDGREDDRECAINYKAVYYAFREILGR